MIAAPSAGSLRRAWLLCLFAALASACSCDEGTTSKRGPVFASSLTKDESGEADSVLHFGEVSLGDRKTLSILVSNLGSATLVVKSTPLQRPFSLELPADGIQIPIGGSSELTFTFRPLESTPAPVEVTMSLDTNEAGDKRAHSIRLVGWGRAPRLRCEPGSLDFGERPKGTSSTLTVSCSNPFSFDIKGEAQVGGSIHQDFTAHHAGDGAFAVAPGETVDFEVSFSAENLGFQEAHLVLRDGFSQDLAEIPLRAKVIATNLDIEPQGCLDFSYVMVGERRRQMLNLRTVGNQGMTVTGLGLAPESRGDFSFVTEPPLELEPGAEPKEVWLEFHPQSVGSKRAELAIETSDPIEGERATLTCAKGFGGGPRLRCERDAVDFQVAAVGIPHRRSLRCVNDGLEAAGEAIEPLRIGSIESSNDLFAASILGGPDPIGYQVGEGFILEVDYLSEEERFDHGEITITTLHHPDDPTRIAVSGQARALPPCVYSIEPPQLRFGVVGRGEEKKLRVSIQNQGDELCLINDLRLGVESDPVFHVETIENLEFEAGSRLVVEVTFAPLEHQGAAEGTLEIQLSDPLHPFHSIPLQGTAAYPCLVIEPAGLDFGDVPPRCSSRERLVSATNTCLAPITVTDFDLGDGVSPRAFQIVRRPPLPNKLNQGERVELQVSFSPEEAGEHWGSLIVETQDGAPFVEIMRGAGAHESIRTDVFDRPSRSKIDILWVMDNSGSFNAFQHRIASAIPTFLSVANRENVDFHVAVTTSGLTPYGDCAGGASGGEDGRFFPIDGSHPRILSPNTSDLKTSLRHNLQVGICHEIEEYFEAAFRALSEPLINETKSSKHAEESPYDDGNAGFLRDDAALSIIFVADEREQSTGYGRSPQDYLAFFRSLKKPGGLRVHAISGSKLDEPSTCGLNNGDAFHTLIEATEGIWFDICTPQNDQQAWEDGIAMLSEGAFDFHARYVLHGYPADRNGDGLVDEADIQLFLDGVEHPHEDSAGERRWSFDPTANAIDFDPLMLPEAGAQVSATYEVPCDPVGGGSAGG